MLASNLTKCYISTVADSIRQCRDVAQLGRALRSGRKGRWFESSHPDQKNRVKKISSAKMPMISPFSGVFILKNRRFFRVHFRGYHLVLFRVSVYSNYHDYKHNKL